MNSNADYYVNASGITFYKLGNGIIQINATAATMKQSLPLNQYTVIAYIPDNFAPNKEFYFPCFASGALVGMIALSPNKNISLFPYVEVKTKALVFNTCYICF